MLNMAEQPDDQEVRWMTAVWADTALHQMVRFEEAMDTYAAARVDYEFRAAFHERGDPPEWASEYAAASQYLTQHQLWNVGAERYFLLHALAQLRKCLLKLPSDGLPRVREDKILRLLRDIDEHWEQGDETRSLTELREWKPDLEPGPGRFWFNNNHVWVGDTSLTEIYEWIEDVGRSVRERAGAGGSPIPAPEDKLPDR
jgi:hypothetical protein